MGTSTDPLRRGPQTPPDTDRSTRATALRRVGLDRYHGLAVVAAVAVGVFGAISYYSDALRSLAHTYTIWLLLVVLLAARRTPLQAAIRGGLGLLVSVVAFYYGKQILYDVIYTSAGFPYRVSAEELLFWGGLGLIGGAGMGMIASRIGRSGWLAAGSSAVIVALLVVDAYQRYGDYGEILPAVVVLVGAAVVVAVGDRSGRQLIRTGYLLVPAVLTVSLVLGAPEWIQRNLSL